MAEFRHRKPAGRLRGLVNDLASLIFPWPSRPEREAEVARARASRVRAESSLASSKRVAAELHSIVYDDNHFADSIAVHLLRGYSTGGKRA